MPESEAESPGYIMHKKSRLPKVDVSQLLKEVSRRPALWQPHHADFNNRFIRAELWRDVAIHLVPNFHDAKDKVRLVASIASRWKSQRATMLRCMRSEQPFLHEREMSFMVPILQAHIDKLKARHPVAAGDDSGPRLRQRKESIFSSVKRMYRKKATTPSPPPMVPPIRIINRNHTTVGWQRVPATPTSSSNRPSLPSTSSTEAQPAAAAATEGPQKHGTTVVIVHAEPNAQTKGSILQQDIQRKLPFETTIRLCRPLLPPRKAIGKKRTTAETPASTDASASATETTSAVTSTSSERIRYPSPVAGEPTVAQELIPPDEAMDTSEEDTNQAAALDGVVTKEEVVDVCSETSEELDIKILAELPFLNNPSDGSATPPQTVVHAYRGGDGESAREQPGSSSPRSPVCIEIQESNDSTARLDSGCPSGGSEQAAGLLRAAARMDSGCPSSSSQEVDGADRRCSDASTMPLNAPQSRSNSTNPLPGGGGGGGLVISDFRGSSPMTHPNTASHNASVDATMSVAPDPDQAFFDSIKPHMHNWSSDKKLDFQFEVLGLLRNFRSKH